MAGSTDRKIYLRSEVGWFPAGAYARSTGDGTLSVDINNLNASAAYIQRSIEGLDQRWRDLGIDPANSDFLYGSAPPVFGYAGENCVLNFWSTKLPFFWETSNQDTSPTNDASGMVTKMGLRTSSTPVRAIIKGVPCINQTTDTVISSISDGGASITLDGSSGAIIHSSGVSNGLTGFIYVTAKANVSTGRFELRAYYFASWVEAESFAPTDDGEVVLWTVYWGKVRYDSNYFLHEKDGLAGAQTTALNQIYVYSFRDWNYPTRTNPQFYDPVRTTKELYITSWEEFTLLFRPSATSEGYAENNKWVGREGLPWENWRVMDGFKAIPSMEGVFSRGWRHSVDTDGSHLVETGGTGSVSTEVPSDVAVDKVEVSESVGGGRFVNTTTHTHPTLDSQPPYLTMVRIIKVK